MLNFSEAVDFRHAARHFIKDKEMDQKDLEFILNSAIKAPSSLNLEHWEFVVVKDKETKKKLRAASFDQEQVEDASAVVVILTKRQKLLDPKSDEVMKLIKERIPEHSIHIAVDFLESFPSDEAFTAWSKAQGYIAASFIMLAAASLEIDSCPMEGFVSDQVLEVIDRSPEEYVGSLIVPLGYRSQPPYDRVRASFDEKVTII
ncbi:NAD(P)H-dependent oxidoreductase [Chengkuizengella axinellae]|uniref:NAD(P)H-dependent oxidoreductase n=1 Tax=Chengkuizengella axinellae TaxID=3064388 RepID=A0ABT9J4N7_9BACL|nr:NAD(P)H-dependent oxidoreductase [Chengkuizengella sp. 2205SS18-9]MDP5276596.1 NAD(P)H-dependent oxidoreductase [Chengkuizengella sp. 2205SS18-9]